MIPYVGFVHICPIGECVCFPSIEFQARPEMQELLKADKVQEVFDLWAVERDQ